MTLSPGDPAKTLTQLVATQIRVQMAIADVRQSQLARRIGKTDQWLSVRLKGKQPIDLNDLDLIAKGLGVPFSKLLPAEDVANTLRNRRATSRTTPDLAERTNASPASAGRPPREPKRQRTGPAGTTPKAATRRPAMLHRPAFG